MIFVINGKKYDTKKAKRIATGRTLKVIFNEGHFESGKFTRELWKTKKGNYFFVTYINKITEGDAASENDTREFLLKNDLIKEFEEEFGELEEA